MTTAPELLASRLSKFLSQEIEASSSDGRTTLLTPVEYPDCDAVAVVVEPEHNGDFVVSDDGAADGRLIGFLGERAARTRAEPIAKRFDVEFVRGRVTTRANYHSLPEACWRVAQASAAVAEGTSFLPSQPTGRPTFDDLLWNALRHRVDTVEREKPLRGLSGHEHRASLYIPSTEAVIEPIAGRKSWDRATRVYAEFGDLRQANGYRLVAVLDDRQGPVDELTKLLSQVGRVAPWTRQADWLETVTKR